MTRSVTEIAAALRDGSTTARGVAERFLTELAERDGVLHSFVAVDPDDVLAQADRADAELQRGTDRGPLHGVPIGVKDIIDVAGFPTRCGSPLYPDTPVATDAVVVRNLRAAGAVIAGKTATHELACGVVTAPTANPWDTGRVPGGSSGGSGAAVGAGLVPIGLGSDTGGSIRIPAALCGTAGLKPTYGLVSVEGVAALSVSLDHLGPLGITVADCAHALTGLVGNGTDFARQLGRDVAGMRFGVLTDAPFAPMQPDVEQRFHEAVAQVSALGATCEPVRIDELDHTLAAEFGIIPLEAYEYHARALRERPGDIDPGIRTLLVAGAVAPRSLHHRASRARVAITRAIRRTMDDLGLDALLSPTLPATAARSDESEHHYGDPASPSVSEHISVSYVRTTAPFNLSGQPAVSVPCGTDRDGMPVGLQIATRAGTDDLALAIAHAYETAARPLGRRPWAP